MADGDSRPRRGVGSGRRVIVARQPALRRRPLLGAVLLASLVPACAGPSPSSTSGDWTRATAAAGTMASAALGERRIPGLSLAILRGSDAALVRGYGLEDVTQSRAVSPATVFQLGSISKQFLAALVLRLAEQRRLSLDDAVTDYVDGFTQLPPGLAVRHLLNHTSGIREPFTVPAYQAGIEDLGRSAAEWVEILRQHPVNFKPGSRWSYSNANYMLLALIVERVTGDAYEQALTRELFQPLGLLSLRQCTPLPLGPGEARGHVLNDDRIATAVPENMNWIRGDGGLCGNALDVARWFRLLATGQVLNEASYRAMTTATRLDDGTEADYGFGLSLVPLDGRPKVAHNGAMLGFSASAAYYPESEVTVVVLTNRGNVRTESIERAIARRLLDLPVPAFTAQPLDAAARRPYLGTYDIGVFAIRLVEREERVWLEMPPPGPSTPLRYLGHDEFAGDGDPDTTQVRFTRVDGRVVGLRLFMGAMHWYAPAPR